MFWQAFRSLSLLFVLSLVTTVHFVHQEAFLAASDLACAHTVGFGSVISL